MSWTQQLSGLLARNAVAAQPIDIIEIDTHVAAATAFISDLEKDGLSNQTKFVIAYSAGHQMLTAAIKMEGYKPVNQPGHRSILYDLISDLFPGAAAAQAPMTRAHNRRNKAEYEVVSDVTDAQIDELITAVESVKEELDYKHKALKKKLAAQTQASLPIQTKTSTVTTAAPTPPAIPKKPPFKKK